MDLIKRIFTAGTLVLALNFLALVAVAGWAWGRYELSGEKLQAAMEVIEPHESPEAVVLEEAPEEPSALEHLESILGVDHGADAHESPEAVAEALAGQFDELDRRYRELHDLRTQLTLATTAVVEDRRAVTASAEQLQERADEAQTLAEDEGFKQTLALYSGLPPKQVKDLFLTLDQPTVVRYLSAMNGRKANKILKEFKRPDEQTFIRAVLEEMRTPDPTDLPDLPQTATRGTGRGAA